MWQVVKRACVCCVTVGHFQKSALGNLAPELKASVARLNAPQLRARIVNAAYFNPQTIMPSYYQTSHLNRVAPKFAGQTLLSGQEIEDVIAFLVTLNN